MTQEERRRYLIEALMAEMPGVGVKEIPKQRVEQERLLRSLMNIREALPVSSDFLEVQDAYLSEEITQRGEVACKGLSPVPSNERIYLWQGDITRLQVGAIVNAANSALLGCFQPCHSCIDNIIHTYAGVQLRLECQRLMAEQGYAEPTGMAKITPAYNLPCDYVLHTVGPIISGPLTMHDEALLENCYQSCLALAEVNGIKSIAFCCISTGVFAFPQQRAAEIATQTVKAYLETHTSIEQVIFNVFTDKDLAIYKRLLEKAEV